MHIPEHIYVNGAGGIRRRSRSHHSRASEVLTVPQRITLGENGAHIGTKAGPEKDFIRNQIDSISVKEIYNVPEVITAWEIPSQDTPVVKSVENPPSNGSTIDENPLREMRLLRRRLGNLSARLMQLEEESARRQSRELGLWAILSAALVTIASMLLRRR